MERAVDFDAPKLNKRGDYCERLYAVSDSIDYGIEPNLRNHGDQLPEGFIYIGASPAGNYFLLSLRDDSYGEVYYKDHEYADVTSFDPAAAHIPESMLKIADTFSDFTAQLYDPDA